MSRGQSTTPSADSDARNQRGELTPEISPLRRIVQLVAGAEPAGRRFLLHILRTRLAAG